MHLKLDDIVVPPHPSAIDLDLNIQLSVNSIKEARSIHRQLMGELQEVRKATLATRAVAPQEARQTPIGDDNHPDIPPRKVSRRVSIRPR